MEKPAIFTAQIISGGRITIPEEIRKIWIIEDGDLVELKVVSIVKPEVSVVPSIQTREA